MVVTKYLKTIHGLKRYQFVANQQDDEKSSKNEMKK